MRTIKIFDTTLRDGEQSPGCSMSVKEKVMVAKKLDELNVDVMEAGFDKEKVFEMQGSLSKMQCSKACHNKLYDDLKLVSEMSKEDNDCKIPSRLVPHCPRCGEAMDVNLRKDKYFVEDDTWHKLSNNYNSFINANKDKRIVFLELGVGFNTPGIIMFPFEKMSHDFKYAYLIRVNDKYRDTVFCVTPLFFAINV